MWVRQNWSSQNNDQGVELKRSLVVFGLIN